MTIDELMEQLEKHKAIHGGDIQVVNGEDYTPIESAYQDIKGYHDNTVVIVVL